MTPISEQDISDTYTYTLSEQYLGTRDENRRFNSRGRWTILRGIPDHRAATMYQSNFRWSGPAAVPPADK